MRLYFLRHGQAESRSSWIGDDDQRPLTSAGRKSLQREAHALAALGLDLELDLVITSPLARALATAEIVADELNLRDRLIVDERLAHGFGPEQLAAIAAEHAAAAALLLVGHEPDFSATIAALVGGPSLTLKKGGLARVDTPDVSLVDAALVWLLPPRMLGA